ncbi:hypothetical protein METBIDRAFT_10343 [Metschnikowia bicuspidata var. bicuspidata NRRL YB-4993]|uniref:HIT-type domain-containing protein n=1 Tax=Metschnikowia bicuspidata var. bicuspidata NRRL YB-4993 TaxID=869754 RepID=A0A1A0HJ49_9ASCO|nr:hypothetical protein METBIDRAFT_10343 [Metschnikowia bicuspidata var. bicuspidata NRRL YB-4993]OBA24179.1 hypothetical protein METBIDRAFT_10343 [Metschnikowia bicuspidata var. bicuspidata NRRL YB-4993]
MALGTCAICTENQAKYKCPTCSVDYCSLVCFKNAKHSHFSITKPALEERPVSPRPVSPVPREIGQTLTQIFEKIARDPVIKSLLQYKALQVHLSILLKLLLDSLLTREPIYENRKEIVNMRLCELRMGGPEENELVEEFVQRVLYLHDLETK